MILPVVLSGGAGTRLWPASRRVFPKQFQRMTSEQTMLQETVNRLASINALIENVMVVGSAAHADAIEQQLREIERPAQIILEPVGRNTAPAIALAAATAIKAGHGETILLVMPADHVILQPQQFCEHVRQGLELAQEGRLVTFGIVPDSPHTGYGYIQASVPGSAPSAVAAFVEKPDVETATGYLQSGDYHWNSGIFMFRADVFLAELQQFASDIAEDVLSCLEGVDSTASQIKPNAELFAKVRGESVDYAVMENTRNASVIPVDVGWSDVGSWPSLHEVLAKDSDGNTTSGDVLLVDTRGSLVTSTSKLVAVCGLDDVVVVETDGAILVAKKDRSQQVKDIVEQLKNAKRESLY